MTKDNASVSLCVCLCVCVSMCARGVHGVCVLCLQIDVGCGPSADIRILRAQ